MAYNPDEPRDKYGKWTGAARGAGGGLKRGAATGAVIGGLTGGGLGGALAFGAIGAAAGAASGAVHGFIKHPITQPPGGRANSEAINNRKTHGTKAVVKSQHSSVKSKGTHSNRSKAVNGPVHHNIMKNA